MNPPATALPAPEVVSEDPGGSVTQAVGILLAAVAAFGVSAFSPLVIAKLLPITEKGLAEMKKINAGYNKVIVPAGTYPKQDKDLPVIGYSTHFITQCKLPEDKIYAVTKAMAAHVADMAAVNKAMAKLTPKDMAEDIGVPLHPGAAKYYREVGALK